jgi:hypothetical protein
MIDQSKFKAFQVEVFLLTDGVHFEMAKVGSRQMLIATDTEFPGARDGNKVFFQEAYGPADIPPELTQQLIPVLLEKLRERRRQLAAEVIAVEVK